MVDQFRVDESVIMKAAESVYDGWFADAGRIDWEEFLDRLECHADTDLGSNMLSPLILRIKRHVNAYRKL